MKNLKNIRRAKGLSQKNLAERTGLTIRIISYYENEATSPPIDKIEIIARALGVTISDLLNEKTSKNIKTSCDNIDPRTLKKIIKIKSLPQKEQLNIWHYVDTVIKKCELEKKQKNFLETK
jgi:transcriptional regulator with XRE-family HTH domain